MKVVFLLAVGAVAAFATPDPYFSGALTTLQGAGQKHYYVTVLGDSLSNCYQGSPSSVTANLGGNCVNAGTTTEASLWTYSLALRLKEFYGDGGSGVVPIGSQVYSPGQQSSQWSSTATWIPTTGLGPYQDGVGTLYDLKAGSSATVTGLHGQTVRIYYGSGPLTGAGFDVVIDGGDKGVFGTGTFSSLMAQTVDISVPQGMHTVQITPKGSDVYLWGAEGRNPHGVSVLNLAVGTCRADCYATSSTQTAFLDLISGSEIPLSLVMFGKNEWGGQEAPATFQQNLTTVVNHLLGRNSAMKVALIDPPLSSWNDPGPYTQTEYTSVIATVAQTENVFHVTLSPSDPNFQSAAAESSAGYLLDGVHLTVKGQDALGDVISGDIFSYGQLAVPRSWTRIINRASGKCLDVWGGPSAKQAGVALDQWDCLSASNQSFLMQPVLGSDEITVQNSLLQVDVNSSGNIVQDSFSGHSSQIWQVKPTGDGFYTLTNRAGQVMAVTGSEITANGNPAQANAASSGDAAQWALIP